VLLVGEEVDLVAGAARLLAIVWYCEEDSGVVPISKTGDAINGVRAIRGVDVSSDLLVDGGVDGVVNEVEIEGGGIGAGFVRYFIFAVLRCTYLTESHFTVKEDEGSISTFFLGSVTLRAASRMIS
jgi:hypothetical protein